MGASKKSSRTNPSIEKRMWSLIIKILLEIFLPAVKERILLPAIPNQCRHQFGKGVIESRPRVTQPSMKDMALSWHSIMALNGTHQSFLEEGDTAGKGWLFRGRYVSTNDSSI